MCIFLANLITLEETVQEIYNKEACNGYHVNLSGICITYNWSVSLVIEKIEMKQR